MVQPLSNEFLSDLITRYSRDELPPCRVCGAPLRCNRMGGGEPETWNCEIASENYFKHPWRSPEEKANHRHYVDSEVRWSFAHWGDERVLELVAGYRELQDVLKAISDTANEADQRDDPKVLGEIAHMAFLAAGEAMHTR